MFTVPDKATMSVRFRPTAENLAMIWSSESKGPGSTEALAAVKLGENPSLLPSNTLQVGPPLYNE